MSISIEAIGDTPDALGESPLWSPDEGALYWVDIHDRKIHRHVLGTGKTETLAMPSEVGSIGRCADGDLIAGTRGGFRRVAFGTGKMSVVADPEPDIPGNRLNDGKVDRRGRFWAGSMQDPGFGPVGKLYYLEGTQVSAPKLDGIRIPNALCWSPDSRTMYFADSLSREIGQFDFDLSTGAMANRRMFVRVPEADGVPDGATVDAEGFLWSAHMDGARVTRYDPDGKIERVVQLPVSRITCVAFGGPNLDILFATTATRRLTAEQLAAQPLAGKVLAVRGLGVRGLVEPVFAG